MSEPTFRMLLCRHGESGANADRSLGLEEGDNAHHLTHKGTQEARQLGRFVKAFFGQPEILREHEQLRNERQELIVARQAYNAAHSDFVAAYPKESKIPQSLGEKPHVRVWKSPFTRTRETSDNAVKEAGNVITDVRENPFLYEMHYGLLDGLNDEERKKHYPEFMKHIQKYKDTGGFHWAVLPLGESQAGVGQRVRPFFETVHRDREQDVNNVAVVAHGITNRVIAQQWMHYPPEWFITEPNQGNCWARLIEGNKEKGYVDHGNIYTGKVSEIEALEKKAGIRR